MGRILARSGVVRVLALACLTLAGLAGGGAVLPTQAQAGEIKPLAPQPPAEAIKPGLTVRYYGPKLRYLDEFVRFVRNRPGTPGDPIPALDFADKGHGAYVMGTKQAEMIGAVIDGMMKFDAPGTYEFAMVANDLVQFQLCDIPLIEKDWDGLPTQIGEAVTVTVPEPGWYKLHVKYFQRRGTAALELLWKKPGQTGDYAVVPAEVFAHLAN